MTFSDNNPTTAPTTKRPKPVTTQAAMVTTKEADKQTTAKTTKNDFNNVGDDLTTDVPVELNTPDIGASTNKDDSGLSTFQISKYTQTKTMVYGMVNGMNRWITVLVQNWRSPRRRSSTHILQHIHLRYTYY